MGDIMQDQIAWPMKTREIQTPLVDSTRWNDLRLRSGDVVVSTYAKSGTTWMQQIVAQILFDGAEVPVAELSPWVEFAMTPRDEVLSLLDAQTDRRIMKTHLPVDALVVSPAASYIYIGRDGRDVALSLHKFFARFPAMPGMPPIPEDFRAFFMDWLLHDGGVQGPFWPNVRSWWDIRRLPNVLFTHFDRLKADLAGEMRRIAGFLGVEVAEDRWPVLIEHCGFDYMKARADQVAPMGATMMQGGKSQFFRSGLSGGWRELLSPVETLAYETAVARELPSDCARWLATGAGAG